VIIILSLFLWACDSSDGRKFDLGVDYKLTDETSGETVINRILAVGKRYKLEYIVNFDAFMAQMDSKNDWLVWTKDETIQLDVKVTLGALNDIESNEDLIQGKNLPDGAPEIQRIDTNVFGASLNIIKNTEPFDFSKVPFILTVDNLGSSNNNEQKVSLEFSINGKVVSINGQQIFEIAFELGKGQIAFTMADNITRLFNNDIQLLMPSNATGIRLNYYTNESKSILFGTFILPIESEYVLIDYIFHIASVKYSTANPSESQMNMVRMDIYNHNSTYEHYYLEITALGGRNYNDQTFGFKPFEGMVI